MAGATAVGTAVYVGGGPAWFLTLTTFFVTSTLLGRVGRARKADVKANFSKGDRRDGWQVLANGGVAAAAALGYRLTGELSWAGAFVGALAACNADTWATELGVLSAREPRLLTTFERVPRGTSGAVSPRGMLATAGGGAVIGLAAALGGSTFASPPLGVIAWTGLGTATGMLGALCDSVLGATVQAHYLCPECQRATERLVHGCGADTEYRGGQRWLTNDWVNACASLMGGLAGATLL